MALLFAQPETCIYPALCHAINRWLWRWSPWHLRRDLEQAHANRMNALRMWSQAVESKASLWDYLKKTQKLPTLPVPPVPAGCLTTQDDPEQRVRTIEIRFPTLAFAVAGDSFRYACKSDDLVDYMADDFVRRLTENYLKPCIKARLHQYASEC